MGWCEVVYGRGVCASVVHVHVLAGDCFQVFQPRDTQHRHPRPMFMTWLNLFTFACITMGFIYPALVLHNTSTQQTIL